MGARDHGLRRIALATTGLVAVSVAGTAVLAAVAYADTRADHTSGTTVTPSSGSTGSSSTGSSGSTGSDTSDSGNSGSTPTVSPTTGSGQATSAGS